jgi:hypothetical protein
MKHVPSTEPTDYKDEPRIICPAAENFTWSRMHQRNNFVHCTRNNIPEKMFILHTCHKGKAVPQHTHEGAGGERMYNSYSFMALDGGEWSESLPHFTPGERTLVPLDSRLDGPQSWSGHRG